MRKKDKLMERWNVFVIDKKHECPMCSEQFRYRYNYSLHLAKCKGKQ
jgi:uncharacterized protein (DUF2225 family)